MSFSGEVKTELSQQVNSARHCQLAELAAIISSCGTYSVRPKGRLFLILQSETLCVARKAFLLLRKTFRVIPDVSVMGSGEWKKSRVYTLAVRDHESVTRILQATKFMQDNGALMDLELPVSSLLTRSECCKKAFIRGAFLSAGSISDPKKSYHMEIVCSNPEKAMVLRDMIQYFFIDAKIVLRKKYHVVYIKEGEGISQMLRVMDAPLGLMELENIRILREISGNVNRKVNCETANLNKTVAAAVEQVRDIEKIRDKMGLDQLPDALREMAWVRLEHPDTPLKDLGAFLDPPVGKSGVNHRLRKLKAIAEDL